MSDHLPECPMLDEQYTKHPLEQCYYCDMLRACEKRVLDAIDLAGANVKYQSVGFAAGLDAAREAVAALDPPCSGLCECLPDTLAAIDALRENKK